MRYWPQLYPFWTPVGAQSGLALVSQLIDAANDSVWAVIPISKTGTITKIWGIPELKGGSGSPGPQWKATIEGLDGSGFPNGVEAASGTRNHDELTAGTPRDFTVSLAKTRGDAPIVLRIKGGTPAPDGTNNATWRRAADVARVGMPHAGHESGGTHTRFSGMPAIWVELADGTVLWPGALSSISHFLRNSGSSPNTMAMRITAEVARKVDGMACSIATPSGADFRLRLIKASDGQVLGDTGIIPGGHAAVIGSSSYYVRRFPFLGGEVTMAVGTDYLLAVIFETATNLRVMELTCPSAAAQAALLNLGLSTFSFVTSNDKGVTWGSPDATKFFPIFVTESGWNVIPPPPPSGPQILILFTGGQAPSGPPPPPPPPDPEPLVYPDTPKPMIDEETYGREAVRKGFLAGYNQGVPFSTDPMWRTITLRYPLISLAERDGILDFWRSARGQAFDFFHPVTGEKWRARFAREEVPYDYRTTVDRYTLTVDLEEALS